MDDSSDLVELVESMLDDAAAVGSQQSARALSRALSSLATAASVRALAIEARLSGCIEDALRHEAASERAVQRAASRLREGDSEAIY